MPLMTTHTSTTFIDPRQEAALLDRYGLSYTERLVPLASIDFDRSKQLNGRSETRANPDKIMEYAVKKLDGEVFPFPVIAIDRSLGKNLVWSGIHRIGADLEIKAPNTRCFVVEIPVENPAVVLTRLKQFSHEANVRHGFATSTAERISAACDELEIGGDLDKISLRFSLRPEEITKGLHQRKVDFQLRQHNIRPESILRVGDKEAILRAPDEHVMRDVANFIKRHTTRDSRTGKQKVLVSQGDVGTLVKDLRREKSPSARAELIANADKEAKRAKPKQNPRGKKADPSENPLFIWKGIVNRATSSNFNEHQLVASASTPDELDAIAMDVKQIRGILDAVERAVERKR